jgi:hypothetical protein
MLAIDFHHRVDLVCVVPQAVRLKVDVTGWPADVESREQHTSLEDQSVGVGRDDQPGEKPSSA